MFLYVKTNIPARFSKPCRRENENIND